MRIPKGGLLVVEFSQAKGRLFYSGLFGDKKYYALPYFLLERENNCVIVGQIDFVWARISSAVFRQQQLSGWRPRHAQPERFPHTDK